MDDWVGDCNGQHFTRTHRATRRPSSPQLSKGSLRLRPNWPFWTGSPNRSSNPLSRIGAHPKTWQLTVGGGWLTGLPPRVFFESGKTLSDLGRTGAIICDRDHICAPPTPRLTGRVSRSRRGVWGVAKTGTCSWGRAGPNLPLAHWVVIAVAGLPTGPTVVIADNPCPRIEKLRLLWQRRAA